MRAPARRADAGSEHPDARGIAAHDAGTAATMSDPDPQLLAIARALGGDTHRMTVGLRALDAHDWIEDGADFDAQLHDKRRLLDGRDDVVAALPDTGDAQHEVLSLLAAHLPRRFPARYRREHGRHGEAVRIAATGESVALDAVHVSPIAAAARLVPEDLCLMRASPDGYRLVAAALCFPTRWRLADKIGQPMLAIHAPVPGYSAAIGDASDGVMAALDAARPVWRANWSLLDSPALYQPQRLPQSAPAGLELGERLWLRSERQTLRRLPRCGDVLFTIRIRQCTLARLCEVPGAAARLLAQIDSMPDALKAYKRIDEVEDALRAWLRQHGGDGG
jgi:hypothetical protein